MNIINRALKKVFLRKTFQYDVGSSLPVNFQKIQVTHKKVESDVSYAVKIGFEYVKLLENRRLDLKNKTVLEIGPGINFGSVMILGCLGAQVQVADRFVSGWDNSYHPTFYKALYNRLADLNYPALDLSFLDNLIRENKYHKKFIKIDNSVGGELSSISSRSVDYIFSNAVLEHIHNPILFNEFYRVSRNGALGFHQIDFRDHRDFNCPLEHLLMSSEEFDLMFAQRHGECGSQRRMREYKALFIEAGFLIDEFEPNMFADDEYLNDFELRLRNSESQYRNINQQNLRIISGRFYTRKTD